MRFTYHDGLLSILAPKPAAEYSVIKRAKASPTRANVARRRTCIMQNNTIDKNVKFVQ